MLLFDEDTHTYTLNGKVLINVTGVPDNIAVRKDEDDEFRSLTGSEFIVDREKTSKFGKAFHKVAALTVRGKSAVYDPGIEPWVEGLNNFLQDENLWAVIKGKEFASIYQVEQIGYSDLGYAGAWDWFFYFEIRDPKIKLDFPRCLLIDWKTSTGLNKKTTRMQTAAYRKMVIERNVLRNNIRIPRWTVQFDPSFKRGYRVDKRCSEAEDWSMFLSCLNVYKHFI